MLSTLQALPTSRHRWRSPSRGIQLLLWFLCCKGRCFAEDVGIGIAGWKLIRPLCDLRSHPSRNQWRSYAGAAWLLAALWSWCWWLWGGDKRHSPCRKLNDQPFAVWFLFISLIVFCTARAELTGESSLCAKKLEELGFLILLMLLADLSKAPRGEQGRRGPATFSSCQTDLAVVWKCRQGLYPPGNLGNWIGL